MVDYKKKYLKYKKKYINTKNIIGGADPPSYEASLDSSSYEPPLDSSSYKGFPDSPPPSYEESEKYNKKKVVEEEDDDDEEEDDEEEEVATLKKKLKEELKEEKNAHRDIKKKYKKINDALKIIEETHKRFREIFYDLQGVAGIEDRSLSKEEYEKICPQAKNLLSSLEELKSQKPFFEGLFAAWVFMDKYNKFMRSDTFTNQSKEKVQDLKDTIEKFRGINNGVFKDAEKKEKGIKKLNKNCNDYNNSLWNF